MRARGASTTMRERFQGVSGFLPFWEPNGAPAAADHRATSDIRERTLWQGLVREGSRCLQDEGASEGFMAEPRISTHSSLSNGAVSNELDALRVQIDEVDRALLEQLNRRANLVLEVGRVKESSGASVYEEAREQRIVKGLVDINPGPFPDVGLGPVFREIISATRSLEQGVLIAYMQ